MKTDIQKTKPVNVTINRLILMIAIYTYPDHICPSINDLFNRAIELGERNGFHFQRGDLVKTSLRANPFLVKTQAGHKKQCTLTPLGLDVVEGRTNFQVDLHRHWRDPADKEHVKKTLMMISERD